MTPEKRFPSQTWSMANKIADDCLTKFAREWPGVSMTYEQWMSLRRFVAVEIAEGLV